MSFRRTSIGIIIIILLFTNSITAGILYQQFRIEKGYEIELAVKEDTIKELKTIQEEKMKENSIIYYTMQLQKLLSEQDLIFLAQEQWEYLITLNGEILNQHTIYIEADSAHIIMAELLKDKEILPEEILEKGKITGNDPNDLLQDHCDIYTTIPYTTKVDENKHSRRVVYDFKEIPHGTVISLKMSPILAARLGREEGNWQGESRIEIIRK